MTAENNPFSDYLTKQQFCRAVPGGPISERTADRWHVLPPKVLDFPISSAGASRQVVFISRDAPDAREITGWLSFYDCYSAATTVVSVGRNSQRTIACRLRKLCRPNPLLF